MHTILQFLPLLTVSIPFATGNWYLSPRIGKNALLWVILSIIPILNYLFMIYVAYQVIFAILDRMKTGFAPHHDATAE
jgi:hypothetical protein